MVKVKEEKVETPKEETNVEEGFDLGELLKDPVVKSLLESGKDIFKKEKTDPDVCEISIKAPSEVVLKLFRVKE